MCILQHGSSVREMRWDRKINRVRCFELCIFFYGRSLHTACVLGDVNEPRQRKMGNFPKNISLFK